jgi:hypothetical protein
MVPKGDLGWEVLILLVTEVRYRWLTRHQLI